MNTQEDQNEMLLPCPFCGEQALEDEEEVGNQTKYFVCCSYCNAMVYSFTSERRAVQAWNNRNAADLEKPIPTLEEWREAWEAEGDEGRRQTISWEEAEKRYHKQYPSDEPY